MQATHATNRMISRLLWSALALVALGTGLTPAQDVILNPVDITGQVSVGDEELTQVLMRAESGSFLATQTFMPDAGDLTLVEYSLTVDVPEGGDRTYAVQPEGIWMDENQDRLILAPQDVMVSDGVPGMADFMVEVGYVEGTITFEDPMEAGTIFVEGYYDAMSAGSSCSRNFAPCFSATTSASRSYAYRIAVPPGTGIIVQPRVFLNSGGIGTLEAVTVDVALGDTTTQDFVVPAPQGAVSGMVAIPGAETAARHTISVVGAGQKFTQVDEDGPYEITGLEDGGYTIYFSSYFDLGASQQNAFTHPAASLTPGRNFAITEGSHEMVDASTDQAYVEGAVQLSGSATPADGSSFNLTFLGASAPSSGGQSTGIATDPATGAYSFVVSEGMWRVYQIAMSLDRAGMDLADQFDEFIRLTYQPHDDVMFSAATGETTTFDIPIPMGKVTVRFGVAGGLLLSNPQLDIGCSLQDDQAQTLISYTGTSRGLNQIDVEEAVTSFLAPAGSCLLTARARVNGTLTSFGNVEVDVEPGVDKEIEVGAPTLIIDYPSPDLHVDVPTLVVLGRASDDVEVTSVTINGGPMLDLTSTGNQDDPNEVSFVGQELQLVPGANLIETTAEDGDGNSTTDTRTVYFDTDASPPILDWTPADGTVTDMAEIEVAGTADDAEGIASITVQGVEVEFVSTGNTENPNEVSFSTMLTLEPGENPITVVAFNVLELSTSQTHTVTLEQEGTPPVAEAGDDIVVPCSGHCEEECGTLVSLDGSGSSGGAGELTYTWTGPFPEGDGTVTGEMVMVTLPLGTHEITLTVDDGSEQSTDTVLVTVEVQVVGLKPPLGALVKAGRMVPLPRRTFHQGSVLPLRFAIYCGGTALQSRDVDAPEIVGLVDDGGEAVDLATADLDAGASNGNSLYFRDGDGLWKYNLRTKDLKPGATYTITIRMPDGQDYQAKFAFGDGNGKVSQRPQALRGGRRR